MFRRMTAAVGRIKFSLRELLAAAIASGKQQAPPNFDWEDGDIDMPWRLNQHFENGERIGVVLRLGPVDWLIEDMDVGNPYRVSGCRRSVDVWIK